MSDENRWDTLGAWLTELKVTQQVVKQRSCVLYVCMYKGRRPHICIHISDDIYSTVYGAQFKYYN
jgi:hypothetical protein